MHLRLERRLSCSPEVAFALLTEPEAMNRWSKAHIHAEAPGDGGHPAGVGALRTVVLPGRGGRLAEVVVESEPTDRFVYRVYRGRGIRAHRGEITFSPVGRETFVTWEVRADFVAPGIGVLAKRMLVRELGESLDILARLAPDAEPSALAPPPRRHIDDRSALPVLYAAAEEIRAEQRALADELLGRNDPRGWFTRSYEHVTALQVRECRRGRFTHPAWVLRLVPVFHRYYMNSLDPSLGRTGGTPEEHWREAFARMQRPKVARSSRYKAMARCTLYGMIAHIEEDLPRALAEVYVEHYQDRCDYVRFRADYLAMESIFRDAGERLLYGELARREIPPGVHVLMQLPVELRDVVMNRELYDIPRNRVRAYGRGERMVRLLSGVRA